MTLFERVFGGNDYNYARTVAAIDEAIAAYGESEPVSFPGTAYSLPCYYGVTGVKITTLGEMKAAMDTIKSKMTRNNPGAAVGFTVGFGVAVAEGFTVALLPEDGLLTALLPELGFVVADGFAVALGFDAVLPVELEDDGLLVVLFSVLDVADELLPFELSVLLLSVFAPGVAVGFALAVLALAVGLLLASFFSDTVLLTALDVELSVTALSVLLPAHAASDTISAAAINIAVIFFFIVVHSSLVSL